jgi:hypothetical protein
MGAAFAGAALAAGPTSESSLSESSSLSLTGFAEALAGDGFEGTAFGGGLVADFEGSSESLPLDSEDESSLRSGLDAPVLVVVAVVAGSSSDSPSLDSGEELALGGGALDCY